MENSKYKVHVLVGDVLRRSYFAIMAGKWNPK